MLYTISESRRIWEELFYDQVSSSLIWRTHFQILQNGSCKYGQYINVQDVHTCT